LTSQIAASLDYGGKLEDPAYCLITPAAVGHSFDDGRDRERGMATLLDSNTLPGGGDARIASIQRSLDREIIPLAQAAALSAAAYDEPTDLAELAQASFLCSCGADRW
jgi:hypothetical protein